MNLFRSVSPEPEIVEIEAPIEPIRIHSDKESRLNQVRINNNYNYILLFLSNSISTL